MRSWRSLRKTTKGKALTGTTRPGSKCQRAERAGARKMWAKPSQAGQQRVGVGVSISAILQGWSLNCFARVASRLSPGVATTQQPAQRPCRAHQSCCSQSALLLTGRTLCSSKRGTRTFSVDRIDRNKNDSKEKWTSDLTSEGSNKRSRLPDSRRPPVTVGDMQPSAQHLHASQTGRP